MKRVFFPPGYAELEPSASYLISSSSGASAFFVPEQTGLVLKLLQFSYNVSRHLAQMKNAGLINRRSRNRAPSETVNMKFFCFIKTPATTTNAL